jgi:hypothetical protein
MKKISSLLASALLICALFISACGSSTQSEAKTAECPLAKETCCKTKQDSVACCAKTEAAEEAEAEHVHGEDCVH